MPKDFAEEDCKERVIVSVYSFESMVYEKFSIPDNSIILLPESVRE